MKLVASIMTKEEMAEHDVQTAINILTETFHCKAKATKYKYQERKYYETDIDLLNVQFTKKSLYSDLDKLVLAFEEILGKIPQQMEIIIANDDTETEITQYEKDQNNIKDFGLFITGRIIPDIQPYYSSETCNAYLNLTYVSFGIY